LACGFNAESCEQLKQTQTFIAGVLQKECILTTQPKTLDKIASLAQKNVDEEKEDNEDEAEG
jgi:hypothetical protein